MFAALGRATVRARRAILAVALLGTVVAGTIGGGVASRLIDGGFDDPDAESSRARALLEDELGTAEPNFVLLVTASAGTVDDAAVAAAGAALTAELAAEEGVEEAVSYWSLGGAPPLRSDDGRRALVLAVVENPAGSVGEHVEALAPRYARGDDGTISVGVGGFAEVFRQVNEQVESDLVLAELIAFPLTLLLLLLVFGSVIAAAMPLVIGVFAILGTFLVLWVIASLTDVSIFALNLTTMLGLGLAIDYSLFVVSRYREELARGRGPHAAVVRTVETAGRTVAFSALTLAVSLSALLIFPLAFLRSFAYAGIAVALLAAIGAVVVLPALLAVVGHRIDRFTLWHHRTPAAGEGIWHRIATRVMRRPVPIATVIVVLLVALGVPFLRIEFGLPDDRVLPSDASSRQVQDVIREEFGSQEAGALLVVLPDRPDTDAIDEFAVELSLLPDVARVDAATGVYTDGGALRPADLPPGAGRDQIEGVTERFDGPNVTYLNVVPDVEPYSAEGEALAQQVRELDPGFEVLVGGPSAQLVDSKASLFGLVPWALLIIAITTFVLLFLMFGSVVVPLKAIVINVLSLSATFGALVWVFQDGNLAGVLDFTATGSITATMPILMFCVAFGLSMDYEVFLLSRIKEEYDRTGDNTAAVALGLERTGRIVTAAAVIISVVFLSFATSGVFFIKLFGIGLALAVLIDAFVIRATLVPAFMRLAGDWNWWAPAPLRRVHERFGISESGPADHDDPDDADPTDSGDAPRAREPVAAP